MTVMSIRVQSHHHIPTVGHAPRRVYSDLSTSVPVINL